MFLIFVWGRHRLFTVPQKPASSVMRSSSADQRATTSRSRTRTGTSATSATLTKRWKELKLARPPVGVYIQTTPSPGSEARSASRRRRRACCYPPSGLDGVPKSSSRARRSVPYSRPAVRFLKRAVDAVKQRRCGSKDRDPLPERGRLGPSLIYIIRRPLDAAAVSDADDGSALAASAPALRW